jgi:hypothetical protein
VTKDNRPGGVAASRITGQAMREVTREATGEATGAEGDAHAQIVRI